MSDEPEHAGATVRSRLAGVLSDERTREHLRNGLIRLDGEAVTDLDTPAPAGTRIVVAAS